MELERLHDAYWLWFKNPTPLTRENFDKALTEAESVYGYHVVHKEVAAIQAEVNAKSKPKSNWLPNFDPATR